MDSHNKLIIQFDPKGNGQAVNCNNQAVMQTMEGLWVMKQNPNNPWIWKKLQSPNIHQAREVTTNYLIYVFSKKISDTHLAVTSNRCQLQNCVRFNTLEHFEGNLFVQDMGDSLALTEYKKLITTLISNNDFCYTDIKLHQDRFLDKESHVIKFNSSQRPCQPIFPERVIKSLEGLLLSQEARLMITQVEKKFSYRKFELQL